MGLRPLYFYVFFRGGRDPRGTFPLSNNYGGAIDGVKSLTILRQADTCDLAST